MRGRVVAAASAEQHPTPRREGQSNVPYARAVRARPAHGRVGLRPPPVPGRSASSPAGNIAPGTVTHRLYERANAWARYRFAPEWLRRLTLGAGVVHVAERFTTRDNAVRMPSYTRVDLTASVELAGPRLVLGLVAENVGDVRYVTTGSRVAFIAGPPRRLAFSLASASWPSVLAARALRTTRRARPRRSGRRSPG